MSKEKTKKTVEFDVSTGWKNQTLDLNKYNYGIQFTNGSDKLNPAGVSYALTSSGNTATVTAQTPVEYYATVKVTNAAFVDDAGTDCSVVDSLTDVKYLNTTTGKTITKEKYDALTDKTGYVFKEGNLKLTLDQWKTSSNYYFQNKEFYEQPDHDVIPFGLTLADLKNIAAGEFQGEKGFYGEYWAAFVNKYDGDEELAEANEMLLSNLHIYRVENNGKAVDVTKAYFDNAPTEASGEQAYSKSLYDETADSKIILKNIGKTGEAWLLNSSGSQESGAVDLLTQQYTIVNNGKSKSYSGSRLDEVATSSARNESFNLGTGTDALIFGAGFGKDTVAVNKTENLDLTIVSEAPLTYAQKGNNAVVTQTTTHKMYYEKFSIIDVTKTSEGKYTYKTSTSQYNLAENKWGEAILSDVLTSDTKVKESTVYNTYADAHDEDHLVSSSKKEPKTFAATTETTDTATLKNYFKVGTDATVNLNGALLATTLKTVAGVGTFGSASETKKQKLTGNFLDNTFTTGLGNDTVKTGAGADTVKTSLGKDSITIDGIGAKIVDATGLVGSSTVAANTTLTYAKAAMKSHTEGTGDSAHDVADTTVNVTNLSSGAVFTKSGNNLVIENGPDASLTVKDFMKKDYIADNTLFGNKAFDELNQSYSSSDYKYQLVQRGKAGKSVKLTDTVYNDDLFGDVKKDTFTFKNGGYDRAFGGEGNDTYNVQVAQEQAAVQSYVYLYDEKGDDTYNVKNWNESVYINDKAGEKDVLAFDKNMKVGYVFDVLSGEKGDAFGSGEGQTAIVGDSELYNPGNIFFYDKDADIDLAGGMYNVNVKDFYALGTGEKAGKYVEGAGYIETVKVGKSTIDFSHLDEIRGQVADFLSTTKYASAYDLLSDAEAAPETVAALIAEYTYHEPSAQS